MSLWVTVAENLGLVSLDGISRLIINCIIVQDRHCHISRHAVLVIFIQPPCLFLAFQELYLQEVAFSSNRHKERHTGYQHKKPVKSAPFCKSKRVVKYVLRGSMQVTTPEWFTTQHMLHRCSPGKAKQNKANMRERVYDFTQEWTRYTETG